MITLYQPAPMFGLPNASPYCMKLEGFLRWQGIPFRIKNGLPFKGPFKKIPFVDYADERLGDSSAIIDQLIVDNAIEYPKGLDLAVGHAFQRMVEEHLYWSMVYFRWLDKRVWPKLRDGFFAQIPLLLRPLVVAKARKQVKQALNGQGLGRLPNGMIVKRVELDLAALNERLSHNAFICGAHMTHHDIAIWALLSQLMNCELVLPITHLAKSFQSLTEYVTRVDAQLAIGPATSNKQNPASLQRA